MSYLVNPGFLTALALAGLLGPLFVLRTRRRPGRVLLKSIAVGIQCFVCLLAVALLGLWVLQSGLLGHPRGWASFGDGYLVGLLAMPVLAFAVCLAMLGLAPRMTKLNAKGKSADFR